MYVGFDRTSCGLELLSRTSSPGGWVVPFGSGRVTRRPDRLTSVMFVDLYFRVCLRLHCTPCWIYPSCSCMGMSKVSLFPSLKSPPMNIWYGLFLTKLTSPRRKSVLCFFWTTLYTAIKLHAKLSALFPIWSLMWNYSPFERANTLIEFDLTPNRISLCLPRGVRQCQVKAKPP